MYTPKIDVFPVHIFLPFVFLENPSRKGLSGDLDALAIHMNIRRVIFINYNGERSKWFQAVISSNGGSLKTPT